MASARDHFVLLPGYSATVNNCNCFERDHLGSTLVLSASFPPDNYMLFSNPFSLRSRKQSKKQLTLFANLEKFRKLVHARYILTQLPIKQRMLLILTLYAYQLSQHHTIHIPLRCTTFFLMKTNSLSISSMNRGLSPYGPLTCVLFIGGRSPLWVSTEAYSRVRSLFVDGEAKRASSVGVGIHKCVQLNVITDTSKGERVDIWLLILLFQDLARAENALTDWTNYVTNKIPNPLDIDMLATGFMSCLSFVQSWK